MGFEHIADWAAYDHMLFMLVLCGVYRIDQLKNLLILVTAFTIGHSLTLALSTLHFIPVKSSYVEFLIPLTILTTCIYNMVNRNNKLTNFNPSYWMALVFGLIHGMGFSAGLKSMLGHDENIVFPLFSFNLGIEAGQLIIVLAVLVISLFLTALFRIRRPDWNFFISAAVFGIAFLLSVQRLGEIIKE
jgi:hypothetical protein